jgi:hypothetical protein
MPRLLVPEAFHPILQFRYQVTTSKLAGAQFYAKSAQQPQADNAPVTVEYVNSYFKVKGKTRWNDITLSCYNFEGITIQQLWGYFQDHQLVPTAIDSYAPTYKHDLKLQLLSPAEAPITTWTLVGAFYTSVNWGDHDRGTDDVSTAEVAISYDYAILG